MIRNYDCELRIRHVGNIWCTLEVLSLQE